MPQNVVDIEIGGPPESFERPVQSWIGWANGYGAGNEEYSISVAPVYNGANFLFDGLRNSVAGGTLRLRSVLVNHLTLQVSGATSDLAWTFSGGVTANGLTVTGSAVVTGNLTVGGNTVLGDSGADTLVVNAAASFASTLGVTGAATLGSTLSVTGAAGFSSTITVAGVATLGGATITNNASVGGALTVTGAATFNGAVTLGNAAGDTITVNGAATFEQAVDFNDPVVFDDSVTFNGPIILGDLTIDDLTVTGNATIGNGNGDIHTHVGVTTFRNAAGSATQLFIDAANNRVIVGSSTALGSATDDRLTVAGGVAYFAGNSGPSIGLRYNAAQTAGWTLGVDGAGANKDLLFLDDGAAEILRVGDTSSTYQVRVTGDLNVTDDAVIGGDLSAGGNVTFTGATVDVGSANFSGDGGTFLWENGGNARLEMGSTGIGFFGSAQQAKPTVVGSRGGNAALADLLSELANLGLITDLTTA